MIRRRIDWWIALALLAAAWVVRLALAARLPFPPLDDPAFYVQTARSLAAGRGLVTDVIWSAQFPFAGITHPSHEYWMPMATLLMAPWIKAFGDSLFVAQIPGALCGALLVSLTYALARLVRPDDRRLAVGAALLVLAGALPVYQSASTDSSAPYALLASGALASGGLAVERRSAWLSLLAGLLCGLACLTRADGLLIPTMLGIGLLASLRPRRRAFLLVALLAAGCGVVMAPWWLRNLYAFGVVQPASPWAASALQDYPQLFNWHDPPTLESLFARGLGFVVGLRAQALGHNLGVWGLIAFPYGVFGWLGLARDRRPVLQLGLTYAVLLMVVTAAAFSVPTLAGLFYHSAGATLPWLAVGAMLVVSRLAVRRPSLGVGLFAAALALVFAQSVIAWPRVIEDSRRNAATFARATGWLAENAAPSEPVLAIQAHSLNLASGRPALTLPAGQDLSHVREMAGHYRARYIVVTESFGLYPEALEAQRGRGVEVRYEAPGVRIYELTEVP